MSTDTKKNVGLAAAAVAVVALLAGIALSWTPIGAGEVGVVRRFGEIRPTVLTEGLNFVVPFLDTVQVENVRVRIAEIESSAASRDLQDVAMHFAVNYQVDPQYVTTLHRRVGSDFETIILYPAIQESLKATAALFSSEEIVTRRAEVSAKVVEELSSRVDHHGIRILSLNILDLGFSAEFNQAIEARQIAEQEVLTARQELEQARVRAEQEIVAAQAEADAMRILNEEITPELLTRLWIERWDGIMPQVTSGDGGVPQLMLPAPAAPAPTE